MSAAAQNPAAAEVLRDEPMSKHTSWRVGGPAEVFFRPNTRAELLSFLQTLDPATPLLWVGLGSNLLVRDGGLRGVVIATAKALGESRRLEDGIVEAGAGVQVAFQPGPNRRQGYSHLEITTPGFRSAGFESEEASTNARAKM